MKRLYHAVLLLQIAMGHALLGYPVASGQSSFTFSASGDYGVNAESWPVVRGQGGDFHLALGDFSYSGDPSGWCSEFKSYFNKVVIVSGNHDEGYIDGYIEACPFPLGGTPTGDYGRAFYFDYPANSPLARFILTTPGVFDDGFNLAQTAIQDAKSEGIPWTIYGSHKVCIEATADKSCEIGTNFFNMLVSEGVDLILQAHAHTYQRTHQFTCASPDSYTASCVVDTDSQFAKGGGTVLVIQGIGGEGTRERGDGSEPDFDYFARIMGNDGCWPPDNCPSSDSGIVQYIVTDEGITEKAIATDGTVFDTFTIGVGASFSSFNTLESWLPLIAVGIFGGLIALAAMGARRAKRVPVNPQPTHALLARFRARHDRMARGRR